MGCTPISGPGYTGFACSRGPKRSEPVRYCVFCLRRGHKVRHTRLCDFRLADGTTCDKPLCAECAVRKGAELDWCPDHESAA